jgi:formylglycine-generating enzyme required for sulfatase activity
VTSAGPLFDRLAKALAGRYTLTRELGHGGMAAVYLATDVKLGRPVAIKVLPPATREHLGAERFQREVHLTAQLSHPHIVPVFEADEADGCLYYVMEYVEGESLEARLRREGSLPLDDAVRVAAEVGDALQYAHERGIIHRDVKPANILLARGHALVADFGIAKATSTPAGVDSLTATGVTVGTAHYMSPEQASGERQLDARSDVYALTAVLYEMLAGEPPFTGPTVQAVMARLLTEPPRPIRTIRPELPAHIERALAAGLAKMPADRPPSARAFVDLLVRPTAERPRAARRGWPRPALTAGAVFAALVAIVGAAMWGKVTSWWAGRGRVPESPSGMVLVPGGEYPLFGGTCTLCQAERVVSVDSFYLDRTEVTVGAYAGFVAAGGAAAPWSTRPPPDLPVTGVTWEEASAHCRWRDSAARLPTETEWEAAARGTDGRRYPWGARWDPARVNAASPEGGLLPIGSFALGAAPSGVLDLAGNAWEWTATPGPGGGGGAGGAGGAPHYVIRGGAFDSPPEAAATFYRAALPGSVENDRRQEYLGKTGFRCARSVR